MALTANFKREAINHGDLGTWHDYYWESIRCGGLGGLSVDVSNVAGAVNVSLGRIGIDDGVTKGVAIVTTAGTVDKSGGTAGVWHALEISVSGTAVTWYLTALAGETDESFMSTTMKGYYDASKMGYYRIASRRVIAFVFLRAALALGRIVNCESGKLGFKGIMIEDYIDNTGAVSKKYFARLNIQSGDWNMDSTSQLSVTTPFVITTLFRTVNVSIISDDGKYIRPLDAGEVASPFVAGGVTNVTTDGTNITLSRSTGGLFDNASHDLTPLARAFVRIEYET